MFAEAGLRSPALQAATRRLVIPPYQAQAFNRNFVLSGSLQHLLHSRRLSHQPAAEKPQESGEVIKPKNEKIKFSWVKLVDPETGALVDTTMSKILANLDKKTHFAELQTAAPFPVVKLISKAEAHERRKKEKELKKNVAKRNLHKEYQFTWSMADNDLTRKLKRARDDLSNGGRVDIVFAPKSRQRGPPYSEMTQRMKSILEELSDVGSEWKKMEIRRGMAVIFIQGKVPEP
ncbi:hypothetical protein Moror_8847 [Moniliophthora roreri MCA 2997]|uniref:Translation initiation factor IF-3 n=2 Tax=Moniliophthora roreri TaxID=221103 RepID=V2YN82_MONRO|nr:hypothetical protein Moror_8847 [Moniliophthora roreri MCA 2997]KAI3604566.1 hypothetical protein WG66_008539 [Moniliophthora roreri]